MYVGRFLFSQFLCVVFLILCTSSSSLAGQSIKKCAENNEYCQTHWECCSNSCLTYLYRCTKNYQMYPYPFLGINHIPTATLDDIIALNFGKSVEATTIKMPVLTQRFNDEESNIGIGIGIIHEPNQKPQVTTTRPDPQAASTTALNAVESCKEVGFKCYHNDECCTKRCHGFLHQCVT